MMSFRLSLARPLASLGFAAAVVVACSSAPVLDNDRLQQVIADGLQQQAGVTATVSCPDNQPIQLGETFTCTAAAQDGTNLTIKVVQTDNAGNVDWSVTGTS
jgi:hypothetical protein